MTIRNVVSVGTDAVNVVFEKPESSFTYEPGQFITIIDTVNGQKLRRAYSLCTTPYLDEYPAVTVKRVPGGQMSNHINDNFKVGNEVEVMIPMGKFTTTYNQSRKVMFFGGGSGITPLYAISRTILSKEPESEVVLVYGNRNEDYIIFKEQLQKLEADYGDRFKVIHILEEDINKTTHYHGRPTVEMIGEILQETGFSSNDDYFICGPQPMMDIVKNGLIMANVSSSKIMMESFTPGVTSPEDIMLKDAPAAESGTSEITILLYGEEYTITAPKKKAVLDAGLDENIDMPYSCQSGLCTACRGKCLEGEISLKGAEGLTQKEKDNGYVLLCVGKPISDKVKVEIG